MTNRKEEQSTHISRILVHFTRILSSLTLAYFLKIYINNNRIDDFDAHIRSTLREVKTKKLHVSLGIGVSFNKKFAQYGVNKFSTWKFPKFFDLILNEEFTRILYSLTSLRAEAKSNSIPPDEMLGKISFILKEFVNLEYKYYAVLESSYNDLTKKYRIEMISWLGQEQIAIKKRADTTIDEPMSDGRNGIIIHDKEKKTN